MKTIIDLGGEVLSGVFRDSRLGARQPRVRSTTMCSGPKLEMPLRRRDLPRIFFRTSLQFAP